MSDKQLLTVLTLDTCQLTFVVFFYIWYMTRAASLQGYKNQEKLYGQQNNEIFRQTVHLLTVCIVPLGTKFKLTSFHQMLTQHTRAFLAMSHLYPFSKMRAFFLALLTFIGFDWLRSSNVKCQMWTVNCQLSTVNCQPSNVKCQN